MFITKEIEDIFKSQHFIQPELKLGGFEFVWSKSPYGIKEEEKQEFEHFIKNTLPILSDLKRQLRVTENAIIENKKLDSYLLGSNVFTPMTKLSHFSQHDDDSASFIMEFASDGIVFVDREEDIWVSHKGDNDGYYSSQLYVRWQLGQLFSNPC